MRYMKYILKTMHRKKVINYFFSYNSNHIFDQLYIRLPEQTRYPYIYIYIYIYIYCKIKCIINKK